MTDIKSDQLVLAESLMYEGKLEEALECVDNLERKEGITPSDRLSTCIQKGIINAFLYRLNEAVKAGESAYDMAQKQNKVYESIDALILKAYSFISADFERALDFVFEAERLINSNTSRFPLEIPRQNIALLIVKAEIYNHKGEFGEALRFALSYLELQEYYL